MPSLWLRALFPEPEAPAPEGAELQRHTLLPAFRLHADVLLLKILKASCDFVKGSVLMADF